MTGPLDALSHPAPLARRRKIGIVGAGIAGCHAAQRLARAGHAVTVFDKARGVGGRASTRRGAHAPYDHGAQYFTARDERFRAYVADCIEAGAVARFEGEIAVIDEAGRPRTRDDRTERFVGQPAMNALVKRLSRGIDVRLGASVTALRPEAKSWTLEFDDRPLERGYDIVLVTTPAPQAHALVHPHSAGLSTLAGSVSMGARWAVMLAFEESVPVPYDAAFVNAGPLTWVARNSSKPGRPDVEAWVLHAGHDWTREHLEASPDAVIASLSDAFRCALGLPALPALREALAHRWMYAGALSDEEKPPGSAFDATAGLGLAGDWLAGSKVQGAWLSGLELAERVLATVGALDGAR